MNEITIRITIAAIGGIIAAWAKLDERKRQERRIEEYDTAFDQVARDNSILHRKLKDSKVAIASLLVLAELYQPRSAANKAKRVKVIQKARSIVGEVQL